MPQSESASWDYSSVPVPCCRFWRRADPGFPVSARITRRDARVPSSSIRSESVPSINSSSMNLATCLQPGCFGRLHVGRFEGAPRGGDLQYRPFAVGTALTGGPPHRSQRALLTHWAPTSGHDAQSLFGIRVQCFDARRLSSAIRGRWHRRIHGCPRRVSSSLSCEPCSLIPAGYLPYPLQRISQIRGPNVGALPWLFPRFPASCPFRVVHIHSLPGAESGT